MLTQVYYVQTTFVKCQFGNSRTYLVYLDYFCNQKPEILFFSGGLERQGVIGFDLPRSYNNIIWLLPTGVMGLLYLVWNVAGVLLYGMIVLKNVLFWILVLVPIIIKGKCKKEGLFNPFG